jgi:glycosyltransferase involved in cell wall biosynthesis
MKGVSVIVCCYNSALRLQQTLQYLSLQQLKNNVCCEIIVVDNNSTDNTAVEAQRIWNILQSDIPFKVVAEPQPGLSAARKKGVDTASFDYIIFCDDDNWLDKNYVQVVYDFFEVNAEYAVVGGQISPAFEEGFIVPDWFEEYKSGYAIGEQGKEGDRTAWGLIWGAGIGLRKLVYKSVINETLPSLLSDRKGKELSSGGDSEMCLRIVIAGYKLYYTRQLQLKHFLPSNRLEESYRIKLWTAFAESNKILSKYYLYIGARSAGQKEKMKAEVKYWLYRFKLKTLNTTEENLIYLLTTHNAGKVDPDFKLIKDLTKIKI